MSIGDVYHLLLKGSLLGRPTINSFHYKQTAGAGSSAAEVSGDFLASILASLVSVVNVAVVWTEVDVYNLMQPADFDELVMSTPYPGTRSGDCLPPFATWSFKYPRTILGLRAGRKGIAGVSEPDQVNGVATPTILAALEGMAGLFGANLTGGTETYEPGVWSTVLAGSPRVPPIFMWTPGVAYERIGTQNSRKFGR